MGGSSEWSTVPPPQPLASSAQSLEPLPPSPQSLEPLPPAPQSLEPLPLPPQNLPPAAPPPPPQFGGAPPAGYQPVYGSQPQTTPPGNYASAPGSGYPPPPPNPPPGYGTGPQYPPPPSASQGLSSNAAAAISYITFIPAVLFLVMEPYNRDRFVRFHAWQCIALTVVAVGLSIIFSVLGIIGFHILWWMFVLIRLAIQLILFVFWLIALIKASQGQWYKIPIVGDLAASFAGQQQ